MEDVTNDIDELKGILSEALGGIPFNVGIFLIVLYNMSYLFYKAFFETRVDEIIQDDCYCDQSDRIVYRVMTFMIMGTWILFPFGYAFSRVFSCCTCHILSCGEGEFQEIDKLFEKLNPRIDKHQNFFLEEMKKLVTTYYLDSEHYDHKIQKLSEQNKNSTNIAKLEIKEPNPKEIANNNCSTKSNWCSCSRYCCFMFLKSFCVLIRFGFRLVIVPLLQLQWLNNYAWSCIFNNILRDYCATITNEYFIGLDHSLVIYVMYVFLLLAILFSIIIDWFPRGTPRITFELNPLKIDVTDSKRMKKQHQRNK